MTVREQSAWAPLAAHPKAASCSEADLAEADSLMSDLGVLLDAGLIVVHEPVLGPARYGVVADFDDAA